MWEVIKFELTYRSRRPATYVYFGILFFMCFMAAWTDVVSIGGATGKVYENSPTVIANMMIIVSAFGLFITSAIMGVPVVRDFEHNTASMLFTTPMNKMQYLSGRFIGSFVVLLFVYGGMILGFATGHGLNLLKGDEDLTTFHLWWYIHPFINLIIPNLIIQAAIFFAGGALTKRMLTVYTQGVLMLVLYLVAMNLSGSLDDRELGAYFDPFGYRALQYDTQYWTIAMKNSQLPALTGTLLLNRLVWVGLSILGIAATFRFFSFSQSKKRKQKAGRKVTTTGALARNVADKLSIPQVTLHKGLGTRWGQVFSLAGFYCRWMFKQLPFLFIVLAGICLMFVGALNFNEMYGVHTYPTTYSVLELIGGFTFFFVIICVFYSGELIWKERDVKMHLIYDAMPFPEWVSITGKFMGFMLTHGILLFVLMLSGMLIQALYGYFDFEIGVYVSTLYTETFARLILFTLLGFFIQVMVNQKFVGHAVFISFFIIMEVLGTLGLEHSLFQVMGANIGSFSDMNAYGHFVPRFSWFTVYYMGFGLALYIAAVVLSVRGADTLMRVRLKVGKMRLTKPLLSMGIFFVLLFTLSGCYIFYNTNVLNSYQTSDDREKVQAEYERTLKKYEWMNQPKIVEVAADVELYPYERDFDVKGHYIIKNKGEEAITDIHVQAAADNELTTRVEFDRAFGLKESFGDFRYNIYSLEEALAPGDSMRMDFTLRFNTDGFTEGRGSTNVVFNGTFFNSSVFPGFGYAADFEIGDDDTRRDNDLPERARMPERTDARATSINLFGDDADRIRFEMTIGTAPDQIAVAPGYLQKEWEDNGRKYYHYKMDAPMVNFYSVLSARYEVKRDTWLSPKGDKINLEVYYHKDHAYNLDNMMEGMKQSLGYYWKNFSPYQYRQVRVLEFPRYASFAQSFANTIPYSESMGFIMEMDEDDIDMPFYITAHEVAHQWWGHQVTDAPVQGGTMLTETMSQYSALMVMREQYGELRMRDFMEFEMDRYLRGRATESKKEEPLAQVEGQGYIRYRKGSVIMYCFQDFVSEDSVNAALRRYLDRWAYSSGEYPTTLDLIAEFEKVTPDSLSYLIDDLFNDITLYENRTKEASYEQLADGRYKVNLSLEAKKYKADSLGNEVEVPFEDWLDVGVLGKDEEGKETILYLQKHKISAGETTVEVIVDEEPKKAGIDPLLKFIDRNPDDNTKAPEKKESA